MEIIDLSKNENPLGCSRLAQSRAVQALTQLHRYPCQGAFEEQLAERHGFHANQVFVANGASEIMDLLARSQMQPGLNAVTTRGSFAAYSMITANAGGRMRVPSVTADMEFDMSSVETCMDENTRIVWLSRPNNPTGTLVPKQAIINLTRAHDKAIVVCDEAYIEYVTEAEESLLSEATLPENLVVLRSFSKLHGIAGLRIGYAVTSPELANELRKLQLAFSVSSVAIAAATGALEDEVFQDRSRETARHARVLLQQTFSGLGVAYLPSVCNFVSFEVDDTRRTHAQLQERGFLVRELEAFGLPRHVRVSTGTIPQTQRFTQAITELVTQQHR